MTESKDFGRIATCVIAIPLGLWSLFWGLTYAFLGGVVGIGTTIAGIAGIVVGLGFFAATYGVFTAQPWAGKLGLAVFGFDVVRRVVTLATGEVTFFLVSALFTVGSIGGLVYLFANRESFDDDSAPRPSPAD